MSTRTPAPKAASKGHGRGLPLVAVLLGILVALLVGAIVVNAVSKDDSNADADVDVEQVRPVEVDGADLAPLTSGETDPSVGRAAPLVSGQDFTGATQQIGAGAGEHGRPRLVVFVAHWCPHCQAEVPRLVEWKDDGTIPDDIDLVAVSTGVAEPRGNYPPSAWLAREGWPGRVLVDDADSSAAVAFGLTSYPFFVALDADGNVVAHGQGELDQSEIEALVAQLEPS